MVEDIWGDGGWECYCSMRGRDGEREDKEKQTMEVMRLCEGEAERVDGQCETFKVDDGGGGEW